MKFVVIVSSSYERSHSALQFIKTALSMRHDVLSVFFMQQATILANNALQFPNNEINIQKNWQELTQSSPLKLLICSTSAARYAIEKSQLATCFEIGTLGQLVETCDIADRVITFK